MSALFSEHIFEKMDSDKHLTRAIEQSRKLGYPAKYSSVCNDKAEFNYELRKDIKNINQSII